MLRKVALSALSLAIIAGGVGLAVAGQSKDSSSRATRVTLSSANLQNRHQTSAFKGAKANTGYAIHSTQDGKSILEVSDDFVIPDTPAPSWQIVDSRGNVYLLNQMKIKGGTNRRITVPGYIPDIAKVQVWCSYAEVLLGEASFEQPVR